MGTVEDVIASVIHKYLSKQELCYCGPVYDDETDNVVPMSVVFDGSIDLPEIGKTIATALREAGMVREWPEAATIPADRIE